MAEPRKECKDCEREKQEFQSRLLRTLGYRGLSLVIPCPWNNNENCIHGEAREELSKLIKDIGEDIFEIDWKGYHRASPEVRAFLIEFLKRKGVLLLRPPGWEILGEFSIFNPKDPWMGSPLYFSEKSEAKRYAETLKEYMGGPSFFQIRKVTESMPLS